MFLGIYLLYDHRAVRVLIREELVQESEERMNVRDHTDRWFESRREVRLVLGCC